MPGANGPVGPNSRPTCRSMWANAIANNSSPTNRTSSQRLTPIPGVNQRRRVIAGSLEAARRGGRAPSCAIELPVEHRDWPEVALAKPLGQDLGQDDAPVVPAGAADGDGQAGLAFPAIRRGPRNHE